MPSQRQPPPPPAPELTICIELDEPVDGSGKQERADELAGRDGWPAPRWFGAVSRRLRPLWRARAAILALVVLGGAALAVRAGLAPSEPVQTAGATFTATRMAAPPPQYRTLVAPASAHPGQTVTLIGYQRRGACESTEVSIDLRPVGHELRSLVEEALPGWDAIVLDVQLPDDLTTGEHTLTLTGALPGTRRGADACAEGFPRTAVLASTVFDVVLP